MLKVFKFGTKRKKKAEEEGGEAARQPAGSGHAGKEAAVASSTVPTLDLNLPSPSFAADNSRELQNTPSKASLWVDVATPSAMGDGSSTSDGAPSQTNQDVSQQHPSNLKRSATVTVRAKAKLSTADVASLLDACIPHLKTRGLGELGLFRPYRWAEDASHQRRMIDLFLRSVRSDIANSERQDVDDTSEEARIANAFWEADHKPADLLARELEYAQGHDLAGVIKWGLRHLHSSLQESATSGAQAARSQLSATVTSMGSIQASSYPEALQTLGEPEAKLLNSLMDLVASVAAYAEVNAMSSTRLCKVLGFWVLGPRNTDYTSYQHFYSAWQQSVGLFERIFIAYLHYRPDLPGRLQQILHRAKAGQHDVHDQAALQASYCLPPSDVSRTADTTRSANGYHESTHVRGRRGRSKSSASVFNHAFKSASSANAEQASDALASEWWQIVTTDATAAADEGGMYGNILAEETARIIAMVDPPPEASSKAGAVSPSTLPEPESPTRRRSMSVDSPQRPTASFRNPSEFHHGKESSAQSASPYLSDSSKLPSWNDFVSGGFDSTEVKKSITLNLGPAKPTAPEELSKSQSSLQRSTSKGSLRRRGTNAALYSRNANSHTAAASSTGQTIHKQLGPQPQLMTVNFISVEDVFADVFLDALPEVELRSKWPAFAIGQLRKPLGAHRTEASQTKWLVVEEVDAPQPPKPAQPAPEPVRSASPTRSAKSATSTTKRDKRPFLGFGRRGNSKTVSVFGQSKKSFSESAQQIPKKTLTPPSQMPPIEQSPPVASETAAGGQEASQEHGSPLAALKSGHSSKSSLSSIRRVQPPSVNALYPTSTKTNTEISSTAAVHEKSQDISRPVSMDATEVLDESQSRQSPTEQAVAKEEVAKVPSASPDPEPRQPEQQSFDDKRGVAAPDKQPTERPATAIGSQPTPPFDTAQTAAAEVELVASPHEPTKPVSVSPTSQVAELPRDRTASRASAASRDSVAKAPIDINPQAVDTAGSSAVVDTAGDTESSANAEVLDPSNQPSRHAQTDAEPVQEETRSDQGSAQNQATQKEVEHESGQDSSVQQSDARAQLKAPPTDDSDTAPSEAEKPNQSQAPASLSPEAAITGTDTDTTRIDVTRPSQDTVREETSQQTASSTSAKVPATQPDQSSPPTSPRQLQPESPSQLPKSQSSDSVASEGTDQGSSPGGSPKRSKKLLTGAKKVMSSPFRKTKKEREAPSLVQSQKVLDPDVDQPAAKAPVTPVSDSADLPAQTSPVKESAQAHQRPTHTETATVSDSLDIPTQTPSVVESSEAHELPAQYEPVAEPLLATEQSSQKTEEQPPSQERNAAPGVDDSTATETTQVMEVQPEAPLRTADKDAGIDAPANTEQDQPDRGAYSGEQTPAQQGVAPAEESSKLPSMAAESLGEAPTTERAAPEPESRTVEVHGNLNDDTPPSKDPLADTSSDGTSPKPPFHSPELQSDAETQFATPFDTPGGLNEPNAELSANPDASKPIAEAARMPAAPPAPEGDHARTQQ